MAKLDIGIRPMKWHIYGPSNEPLCWDDQALEFDTEEDAKDFLMSAITHSEHDEEFYSEAIVKESILYYDGGYLNATDFRVEWDGENCETILVMK